jgi:adenylosuccinate lyase
MLEAMTKILSDLYVNKEKIKKNLGVTKGQIFAEFVLDALIKKGVPRFKAYRDIQRVAFAASDEEIEFLQAVKNDKAISTHLTKKEIESIFVAENQLGASGIIIKNVFNKVKKTCSKFT